MRGARPARGGWTNEGAYRRGNGDPGRWTFDGRTLTLNWTNWGPVAIQPDGSFAAPTGGFTLRR